jgi:Mg/Co/Ni transporter MgtE
LRVCSFATRWGQAALGAAIGLAGAVAVERLTQTSFYGVARLDTMTGIVAMSILVASVAASVGPLFRAMTVDPAVAIRPD